MAKNDNEMVKNVLANIDLNNEEILRHEKELKECNTSEESLEVKEELILMRKMMMMTKILPQT